MSDSRGAKWCGGANITFNMDVNTVFLVGLWARVN